MPQYSYGQMPQFLNGQVVDLSPLGLDSRVNEMVQQISNVASAGTAAGAGEIYSITATGPSGEVGVGSYTSVGADTSAVIIAGLIAAWNADPVAAGLGVAAAGAGDSLDITFEGEGLTYTVVVVDDGATLTPTVSQAADGTNIGLAVAVAYGTNGNAVAVGGGTVDANVIGFSTRNVHILTQESPSGVDVADLYRPGEMLSVMRQGTLAALVEDAVTDGAAVFIRIANVTQVGDPLGMPRSDADGGDAIQLTGCRYKGDAAARALAVIEVNRP